MSTLPAADRSVAGYDLERQIGRGGFSSVYLARGGDRRVVVKVIDVPAARRVARTSFARETAALERLSGTTSIVDLLGAGLTEEGHPYLVLPYFERGSMDDLVDENGPLAVGDALAILGALAEALEAAHAAGILHRDVKPSNVLLDDEGCPVLSDFGLSSVGYDGEVTLSGGWASPAFTAPELIAGEAASVASDLYSVGATVFAVLAGHPPFRSASNNVFDLIVAVRDDPAPPIERSDVPPELSTLIGALMAKDPSSRPGTAADLILRVQDIRETYGFSTTLVSTPPHQPSGSRRRSLRRRPRPAVMLVAATAVVVAGAVIGLKTAGSGDGGGGVQGDPTRTGSATSTTATPTDSLDVAVQPGVDYSVLTPSTPWLGNVMADVDQFMIRSGSTSGEPFPDAPVPQQPARFSYLFKNNRDIPGCSIRLGTDIDLQEVETRAWGTELMLISVKSFTTEGDAHDYFTGMAIEFGADAGECTNMEASKDGSSPFAHSRIDHREVATTAEGYSEINSWVRAKIDPSRPDVPVTGIIGRIGPELVWIQVLNTPGPAIVERINGLLDEIRASVLRHRPPA